MTRRRTWTDEQLSSAVAECESVAQVLRRLGLKATGANYASLQGHVARLSLSTSHWTGKGYLKGKRHNWGKKQPLDSVLVKGVHKSTSNLRTRLIKEGVLQNKCYECGLVEWNGKPLTLQLDHKNGDRLDNRLDNLRILCPNCHSQTATYAGRNRKRV